MLLKYKFLYNNKLHMKVIVYIVGQLRQILIHTLSFLHSKY